MEWAGRGGESRGGSGKGAGDLYRIPQEAIGSASPLIKKQSLGASRLVKLSGNPFVTTLEARMLCAEGNVHPNF